MISYNWWTSAVTGTVLALRVYVHHNEEIAWSCVFRVRTGTLVCLCGLGLGLGSLLLYRLYERWFPLHKAEDQSEDQLSVPDFTNNNNNNYKHRHQRHRRHTDSKMGNHTSDQGYMDNRHFIKGIELQETGSGPLAAHSMDVDYAEEPGANVPLTAAQLNPGQHRQDSVASLDSSLCEVEAAAAARRRRNGDLTGDQQSLVVACSPVSLCERNRRLQRAMAAAAAAAETTEAGGEDCSDSGMAGTESCSCWSSPGAEQEDVSLSSPALTRVAAIEQRYNLQVHRSRTNSTEESALSSLLLGNAPSPVIHFSVRHGTLGSGHRRTGSSPPDTSSCLPLISSPSLNYRKNFSAYLEDSDVSDMSLSVLEPDDTDPVLTKLTEELSEIIRELDELGGRIRLAEALCTAQHTAMETRSRELAGCRRVQVELKTAEQMVEDEEKSLEKEITALLRDAQLEGRIQMFDSVENRTPWSVGPLVDLQEYGDNEWRGDTHRARTIRSSYSRISPSQGRFIRTIRGDNYCALRAALYQLLLCGAVPAGDVNSHLDNLRIFASQHPWLTTRWTFAEGRLKVTPEVENCESHEAAVLRLLCECVECLYTESAELAAEECPQLREWYLLERFNSQPRTEVLLLEGVKVLMLLRASELYVLMQEEQPVPMFTWLLFARDTCSDVRAFCDNHLDCVGGSAGLEQVEMVLLADVLGVRLRVLRLSEEDPDCLEAMFCAVEDDMKAGELTCLTLLAEDDRHYNVLVS